MTNGLVELGMVREEMFPEGVEELLTWARTAAAWAGEGKVRKQ
jgi:type II secretory pathway predicted ATPase ExeA